jgi:hypothetical protein
MAKTIQERIDLTPNQDKAFKELILAIKKCKKANVYFYQVLETLYALNGNQVGEVVDDIDLSHTNRRHLEDEEHHLGYKQLPSVKTTCSWADDAHYAIMKDEV